MSRLKSLAGPPQELRVELVKLLYTALPQVASSTFCIFLSAVFMVWRSSGSWHSILLLASTLVFSSVRIGALLTFPKYSEGIDVRSAQKWEHLYALGAIGLAITAGINTIIAFQSGSAGEWALWTGLCMGMCGGASATRLSCIPWIPVTTGAVLLTALSAAFLSSGDFGGMLGGLLVPLYGLSYFEACRHTGQNLIARMLAEREARHLATHDSLTGLPNRYSFNSHIERSIKKSVADGIPFAVFAIDLDGFKLVNDTYGHAGGDELLLQVSERLGAEKTLIDCAARLGGDEFAVVTVPVTDYEQVAESATRLLWSLSQPYTVNGQKVSTVSASIGVACWGLHGIDGGSLLMHADQALYRAKRSGRRAWIVSDVHLDAA